MVAPNELFALLLPSIVSAGAICFVPNAARRTLKTWLALQIYDAQPRKEESLPADSKLKSIGKAILAIALMAAIQCPFFWLLLSDGKEDDPKLTAVPSALPSIYIALITFGAGVQVTTRLASTHLNERILRIHDLAVIRTNLHVASKSIEARRVRLLLFCLGLPALCAAGSFQYATQHFWIPIVIAVSMVATNFAAAPTAARGYASFRVWVLGPFIYLGTVFVIAALVVLAGVGAGKTTIKVDKDSAESVLQFDLVLCPWVWMCRLILPVLYTSFGLRFDYTCNVQGPIALPPALATSFTESSTSSTEEKADETNNDDAGPYPTPLSSISLQPDALHPSKLPTYRAGMRALIFSHFFSLLGLTYIATVHAEWMDLTTLASSPLDSTLFVLAPGMLAIVIVPVNMLIAAHRHSPGGAAALWKYAEKWGIVPKKRSEEDLEAVQSRDAQEVDGLLSDSKA